MTGVAPFNVAEKIVWARKRKGISQERLAGLIGTSRRHMIRIEKGHQVPGAEFRRRICEATEQDENFLEEPSSEDDSEAAQMSQLSLDAILQLRAEQAVDRALAARFAREGATT